VRNIFVVAQNTFKEAIRDKILYVILGFAALFILSTIFFGSISLGEDIKVIKDFGLAGIYLFSLLVTIFVGASLIYKEIEKRTLYVVLSKPISHAEFIIGKFIGLYLSVFISTVLMTLVYLVVVAAKGGGFDAPALIAILLQFFEIAIFVALMILFSTFSTPIASTVYAILILYIGHSLDLILKYAQKHENLSLYFVKTIYYILPNLEKFNVRNLVVHHIYPSGASVGYSFLYAVLYSTILLILATWKLKHEDL